MRSHTPTDAEACRPLHARLTVDGHAAACMAANLNQPGEMFLPASHNGWASALIAGGYVRYLDEADELLHEEPLKAFKGVTAVVSYPTGEVSARLVLEHEEEDLSIFLTRPMDADDFGFAWEAWLEVLELPARLKRQKDGVLGAEGGAASGSIMPTLPRRTIQILRPKPRRARAFFRDRRPKFLVFRNTAVR